jgi:hypothetical protein
MSFDGRCELVQDEHCAITILDVGSVHNDLKEITKRINDNVALATTDFLAGVVAAFITHPSSFDALTVDDAGSRIGSVSARRNVSSLCPVRRGH